VSRFERWVLTLALAVAPIWLPGGRVNGQVPSPSNATKSMQALPGLVPAAAQSRVLDVGSEVADALGPDDPMWPERRYVDAWELRGRAGWTVAVDLISDEFDAVLYLVSHFQLTWNDDGAGGCNARVEITFPENGAYTLLASSYAAGAGGRYTLRVTDHPSAPLAGSCAQAGQAIPAEPPPPPNETCTTTRFMGWLTIAAGVGDGPDMAAIRAKERTACDLGIEVQSGDTWPSGDRVFFGGRWSYPNGTTAFFGGGWNYPNGSTASFGGRWSYSNGNTAYFGGMWFLPNGTPTSESGIMEYALARLASGRGEDLLAYYRDSTGDWRSLMLVVMASEASRSP
jgi:hypothetical protein